MSSLPFPYKCTQCTCTYMHEESLKLHMKVMHPIAYKEAQMATGTLTDVPNTLTIPTNKIGKAKKQRDMMRNRYRTEISRYAATFGCTQFEAAHAIFDTLLKDYDNSTAYTQGDLMPNQLAQTFLPYTTDMVEAKQKQSAPKPESAQTIQSSPVTMKMVDVTLKQSYAKTWGIGPKTVMAKKLDKDVTESDIKASLYAIYSQASSCYTIYDDMKHETAYSFYVMAHGYLFDTNTVAPGSTGWKYMILEIPKSSPYVPAEWVDKFHLGVPSIGFKWRKLKNKQVYKLQQYGKKADAVQPKVAPVEKATYVLAEGLSLGGQTVSATLQIGKKYIGGVEYAKLYPNLPQGYMWLKDPTSGSATVVDYETDLVSLVPFTVAAASPAPPGYHWEKYLVTGGTSAILMPGDHGPDGKSKFNPEDYMASGSAF